MPNLYDFPAPLAGVNEGLQNLQQGLIQAQKMRGMQQEMQGQGMRNQLYQMELGQKQQDITRQAELERRLQGDVTGQDIEKAYSGVYPVKGAEMRIAKEQERLKIKLGTWKELVTTYKDNPEMLNQLLEMGNTDPEIKALGITGIKAVDSGIELTQEREYPANAFGEGSLAGTYEVKTVPGKPKQVKMVGKKIDKTIDLGDKVRIVYTDGTIKDEKKGVSPSTDIQERRLTAIEKKEAKKEEIATKKEVARLQIALQKADIVSSKIDEALSQTGFTTTGLTGTVLGKVPGTKAYDLENTIDTIKANIGFNELAEMRAASPTGGALGQIAVRELEFLQAALGSLNKGQSQGQLVETLKAVKQHYANWKATIQGGKQQEQSSQIIELPEGINKGWK